MRFSEPFIVFHLVFLGGHYTKAHKLFLYGCMHQNPAIFAGWFNPTQAYCCLCSRHVAPAAKTFHAGLQGEVVNFQHSFVY